jgi:hypothetical protein
MNNFPLKFGIIISQFQKLVSLHITITFLTHVIDLQLIILLKTTQYLYRTFVIVSNQNKRATKEVTKNKLMNMQAR